MKWFLRHRYTLLSVSLSLADSLFVIGAFKSWFWATSVLPHTELAHIIARIQLSGGIASIACGVLAIITEKGSAASKVALILACTIFYLLIIATAV